MPFIELANIIPAKGIMYLGMYHGSNCNTNCVTNIRVAPPPTKIEINADLNKSCLFLDTVPNAIQLAMKTMKINMDRIIKESFDEKI